jgi:predicted phosphoribosyltransferase
MGSPSAGRFEPSPFRDRAYAGRRLAQALEACRGADLLVVSLSGGGAIVAAEVSQELHARLDLLLMRQVRSPLQPDLAIGFIVDGPAINIFCDRHILAGPGVSENQFWDACQYEIAELRRERERYLGDRQPLDAKGRTLILVDDGLATGHMMRAALGILRSRDPKRIVVALPIASKRILDLMRGEADEIVHLGLHHALDPALDYAKFRAVSGDDVIAALTGRI